MIKRLRPFLADTLWFGMTSRISFQKLKDYGELRAKQGFNAVQVVIGIPPEVGPLNPNAHGEAGAAWDLQGQINYKYLEDCKNRVALLNGLGITVIIYGAWGHQISWLGVNGMKKWWEAIIQYFEDFDVVYCVTGESSLWVDSPNLLLPDKSTKDFIYRTLVKSLLRIYPVKKLYESSIGQWIVSLLKRNAGKKDKEAAMHRKEEWATITEHIYKRTKKTLLLHTVQSETSLDAIENAHLLSAISIQTGHSQNTRKRLWQDPIKLLSRNPKLQFVNLEPWYEGILDDFKTKDQIYAYWVTMLAGASAYCYGAHGVWNCGDGEFLSQWGNQTLDEALQLITPELIGKSHSVFLRSGALDFPTVEVNAVEGTLVSITKKDNNSGFVSFYPGCPYSLKILDHEKIFDPLIGEYITSLPYTHPCVILSAN